MELKNIYENKQRTKKQKKVFNLQNFIGITIFI